MLCFNAEQNKWFMYYTARRGTATDAPGVTWIHGTNIGMAESADGGATWTYRDLADIGYGKDAHPTDYTYWAPEVIWVEGTYHMFLTYVPGIFNDWGHPREIVHLTSKDGVKWDALGRVDLQSDRTIDACVIQLPDGTWRMWYKDERKEKSLSYADSTDLKKWEPKGNAVTDFNGEGPKVIHWKGRYWLIADCWVNGMRVWSSDDCTNWKLQEQPLFGSHGWSVQWPYESWDIRRSWWIWKPCAIPTTCWRSIALMGVGVRWRSPITLVCARANRSTPPSANWRSVTSSTTTTPPARRPSAPTRGQ